ncbi:MAG: histidine phosphatase family protein [Pseudomonadota bacterium]
MSWAIMRHGEAGPAVRDAERPLTLAGRDVVIANAQRLLTTGVQPFAIVHSPLLRARETAELVRDTAYPEVQCMVDNALLPSGSPQGILDLLVGMDVGIASETTERDILLVGHQPLIGHLAADLAGRLVSVQPGTILGMSLMEPDPPSAESERLIEEGKIGFNREYSLTWIIE